MTRYASIDVGTNSVLLLVAEKSPTGRLEAVVERAEITRLGRGVDRTRLLSPEAIEDTVKVLEAFTRDAHEHGAEEIVVSATSAARDASNGPLFLDEVRRRCGLTVEILSGDDEARLSFASALADFDGHGPMIVLDIGGGSTEFVYGDAKGQISFRHSFDVGSVRMTERFVRNDPPIADELAAIRQHVGATLGALPAPPPGARLVGVAGTVTTLCAVTKKIEPYDSVQVQGAVLTKADVETTVARLAHLPLQLRRTVPGLQPKRADVIVAGGLILAGALEALGLLEVTVSDRGLRWGLLADRFGKRP